MNVRNFLIKNRVLLVTVPGLVGAHYGWYRLQDVEALVPPEDRNRLPFFRNKNKQQE